MTSATTPNVQVIQGWTGDREDAIRSNLTGHAYKDLSTIIIMPTRGMIHARVVDSFMSIIRPPNQKSTQLFISGMEVGDAYNSAIDMILNNNDLSQWKYVLTVEEDNLIPPDALLALLNEMNNGDWDVLGGLYYTKGDFGVPQIWGDPTDPNENYRPLTPEIGQVIPCNGTGMGCTLFKTDVFRKVPGPWFVTKADRTGVFTQDLWFYHRAREAGVDLSVAIDCRIRVGHLDVQTGEVW